MQVNSYKKQNLGFGTAFVDRRSVNIPKLAEALGVKVHDFQPGKEIIARVHEMATAAFEVADGANFVNSEGVPYVGHIAFDSPWEGDKIAERLLLDRIKQKLGISEGVHHDPKARKTSYRM